MSSFRVALSARSSYTRSLPPVYRAARIKVGHALAPGRGRSSVPRRVNNAENLPQSYMNIVRCSTQLSNVTSNHRAPPTLPRTNNTPDLQINRVHNFSAGPGPLPLEVMVEAQNNFVDFHGSGMGFMEMSHRDVDGPVQRTMRSAESNLRELLHVPENFKILFLQGGAHGQFAAVPLNLANGRTSADYIMSGFWSERSVGEASRYINCNVAADAKSVNYKRLPDPQIWQVGADPAYTYMCANETIHGLELLEDVATPNNTPLVGDFTSTLLSRTIDWSKYGVVFASAGKNLGPAGINVTIVREDLLGNAHNFTPSVLNWTTAAETKSLYNTPPTYLLYMMNLVLEWTKANGGVEGMQKRAIERSQFIYDIIDKSDGFYSNHVQSEYRSRMNVPFRIGRGITSLEKRFTKDAEEKGIFQLTGHHLFGGLRATLYNGVPDESVYEHLGSFMKKFQEKHQNYISDEDEMA